MRRSSILMVISFSLLEVGLWKAVELVTPLCAAKVPYQGQDDVRNGVCCTVIGLVVGYLDLLGPCRRLITLWNASVFATMSYGVDDIDAPFAALSGSAAVGPEYGATASAIVFL